jgi:hypothetical protein
MVPAAGRVARSERNETLFTCSIPDFDDQTWRGE